MEEQDDLVYGETFQLSFVLGKRRVHPRYPLGAPVQFVVEGMLPPETESGEGRDISLGGIGVVPAQIHDNGLPEVGARVHIQLSIEGIQQPISIEGVVVHASEQKGFGVRFLALTAKVRKRLKRLITSQVKT
jgi:c-di-GMP-binding flagellar brake protein YcgR